MNTDVNIKVPIPANIQDLYDNTDLTMSLELKGPVCINKRNTIKLKERVTDIGKVKRYSLV